jgi:hypothetical protein
MIARVLAAAHVAVHAGRNEPLFGLVRLTRLGHDVPWTA